MAARGVRARFGACPAACLLLWTSSACVSKTHAPAAAQPAAEPSPANAPPAANAETAETVEPDATEDPELEQARELVEASRAAMKVGDVPLARAKCGEALELLTAPPPE